MKQDFTIAIGVVVDRKGKVLLIRRAGSYKKGFWESPAGHIEEGEAVVAAALREIEEETGLSTVLFSKTISFQISSGIKAKMFLARVPGGDSGQDRVVLSPKEHSDFKWVHVSELKSPENQPQNPHFRERVFELLSMNDFPVEKRDLYESISSQELKGLIRKGDKLRIRKITGEEIKGEVSEVSSAYITLMDSKKVSQCIDWNPMSSWTVVSTMRGVIQRDFLLDGEELSLSDEIGLLLENHQGGVDDAIYSTLPSDAQMPLGMVQPSMFDFADAKVTLPFHRTVMETLQDSDLSPINSEVDGDRILVLFDSPRKAREAAEALGGIFEVNVKRAGLLQVLGK